MITARDKALQIDRCVVLEAADNDVKPKTRGDSDALTFVINHDKKGSDQIRLIVKNNQEMINYLFGREVNIIIAERRSPNTGSLLFAKSGFAKELCGPKDT